MDRTEVPEMQETPATVVEVADYDPAKPQFGKFVRVQFAGEVEPRRYSLDKDLDHGKLLPLGAKVKLRLVSFQKAEGARNGSGRVYYNEKRRVIGAIAA